MTYNEIIKKNNELEDINKLNEYKISILSNIMVHQSKEICEYSLRLNSINTNVYLGNYDNILQDTLECKDSNSVIIFWELYNLIDGLEYKIDTLNDDDFINLVNRCKTEINMVVQNLKNIPLVIMNKFSTIIFEQNSLNMTRLDELANILNIYLDSEITSNTKIINIDKVISKISTEKSIDLRYYYSSKSLYSIEFYKEYFEYIKPILLAVNGKSKKALIFDCDNTLWKGILGEDGFENIKIFHEIQHLAIGLAKKGIIIGLCSKNNPEDIDNVLAKHKDMILKDEHIVIKKVNWNDKSSNLKLISKELNIGLDSLIFVDDSSFEVNLIRETLPMVKVFQVPTKKYEYLMMIKNISNLFYNTAQTDEDNKKIQMYKAQVQRSNEEEQIGNISDYLNSLDLNIQVYIDDITIVERISQLTQKTNQFNLRTKRYTKNEISLFIKDDKKSIIAIGVNDKFGDNGIVGLVILDILDKTIYIDTLLMSCRILGRNIEYKLMDIIIDIVKNKNISTIESEYISTYKNQQVENLFNTYGFSILKEDTNSCKYKIDVKNYTYSKINYIKVGHAR